MSYIDYMVELNKKLVKTQDVDGMTGKLVSRVPQLLEGKGWNKSMFAGQFMIRGSSPDTAYRLARGETRFTTEILLTAAEILACKSIADLIEIEWDSDQ